MPQSTSIPTAEPEPVRAVRARLYSWWAVDLATALGGVFAGLLLVGLNFRAWGEVDRARSMILAGILWSLFMLFLAILIPFEGPWARVVYQGVQVGIAHLYCHSQRAHLEEHSAAGGRLHSLWRAAWIGIACGLGLTILYFGSAALIDVLT